MMPTADLPPGVVLRDGGMGQELRRRSPAGDGPLWSAQLLIDAPEIVQAVHEDYIRAGARIVTTNSNATTRPRKTVAGRGKRCASTSHGGFDNDLATMNDLLKRVLGKKPPKPFTEAEMKGY